MQKDCRLIILVILIGCHLNGLLADDLKNTHITVYNEDPGLIYQEKNLDLEKGLNTLRIEGVSAQISPATVKLNFPRLAERAVIAEQNSLYDLVSTAKIFEKYAGEDRIQHTSRKDTLRLKIGDAFDVRGEHLVIDRDRSAKRAETVSVEIRLTNRKVSPVDVEVIDHIYRYGKIEKASHGFRKESSQQVLFPVTVRTDTTETISYVFYRRW